MCFFLSSTLLSSGSSALLLWGNFSAHAVVSPTGLLSILCLRWRPTSQAQQLWSFLSSSQLIRKGGRQLRWQGGGPVGVLGHLQKSKWGQPHSAEESFALGPVFPEPPWHLLFLSIWGHKPISYFCFSPGHLMWAFCHTGLKVKELPSPTPGLLLVSCTGFWPARLHF